VVGHLDEGVNSALVWPVFIGFAAVAVTILVGRCLAPSGIQRVERLAFCVDADVRVMLPHLPRQWHLIDSST
jgi:hypothetical protein